MARRTSPGFTRRRRPLPKPRKTTAKRKRAYRDEIVEQARLLCKLGATQFDLAEFFKVSEQTIKDWRHEKPGFADALKIGRAGPDQRVKRALYERCIGYSFMSEKVFCSEGVIIRTPFVEHVPPDVGAIRLWVMNRMPDEFRSKPEDEAGGNITVQVVNFAGASQKPKALIEHD